MSVEFSSATTFLDRARPRPLVAGAAAAVFFSFLAGGGGVAVAVVPLAAERVILRPSVGVSITYKK